MLGDWPRHCHRQSVDRYPPDIQVQTRNLDLVRINSRGSCLSQKYAFVWALVQYRGLLCCAIVTRGVIVIFNLWCQSAYPKLMRSSGGWFKFGARPAVVLPPVGCSGWYVIHDVKLESLFWVLVQSRGLVRVRCSSHATHIMGDHFVRVVSTPRLFSSIRHREFPWHDRTVCLSRHTDNENTILLGICELPGL